MSIFKDILNVLRREEDAAHLFKTPLTTVPGIGTGAAYASGDAFGTRMVFHVPVEGTISNVVFFDKDDEGFDKELVLFDREFEQTADNSAFAPTDSELQKCVGVCFIDQWSNFSANQIGQAFPALSYVAPEGILYAQIVTRGVDNIAADNIPQIYLVIV